MWDGFPWALLGYSQVTMLPIAQIASLVGVYGLSALLALVRGRGAGRSSIAARRWIVAAATALLVVAGAGVGRVHACAHRR